MFSYLLFCTQFTRKGGGYGNNIGYNKFKTFLTFPASRYTIALQHVGDAFTGLAILFNLVGILVIANAASFKVKRISNPKFLFIYLSVLIIIQSSFKLAMLHAEIPFTQKQYIFLFFAAFLLLRRLTMVVLSIDQIAIIKLDFHYNVLFTKKTIIFLLFPTYIVAVEFLILRLIFKDFDRSQIVTTCNVLTVDSVFIVMTFISIFFVRQWRIQRKNLTESAKSKEAFLAILCIMTIQIILSIIPDIIGTTALIKGRWKAEWKSGTHIASAISALCDPLFYILFIGQHRKTLKNILKKRTLLLRSQASVLPQGSAHSSTK